MKNLKKYISLLLVLVFIGSSVNVNVLYGIDIDNTNNDETVSSSSLDIGDNGTSAGAVNMRLSNLVGLEPFYNLPPLPEDFNCTNYIIAWYPLMNTFKLAGSNSAMIWDNDYTSSDFPGKYGAVNVNKMYTLSDTLEWTIEKDENTNFVVWITNDGNTDTSAKTLIYSNQTINSNSGNKPWFNKTNYSYSDISILRDKWTLSSDVEINSDCLFIGDVDLNGYDVTINGNLMQIGGKVELNGGSLTVSGDYIIGSEDNYGYASLIMSNTSDSVYVGGDLTVNMTYGSDNALTAGTIEVKGDFIQKAYDDKALNNFAATGTHKVILSGNEIQNISFETPIYSKFNELVITKPLNKGYIVDNIYYTTLTEDFDNEAPTVPQDIELSEDSNGNPILTWQPSTDNIKVLGYNIYCNNQKVGETQSCEFNINNTGTYYITALDYCNESQSSQTVVYAPQTIVINSLIPEENSTIYANSDFTVNLTSDEAVKNIALYYKEQNSEEWTQLSIQYPNTIITETDFVWTANSPANGIYDLKVVAEGNSGYKAEKIFTGYTLKNDVYKFDGHRYKVIDESMIWTEAKEYCENLGGHLLTITSAEEQNFVSQTLLNVSSKKYFWLGATDLEREGDWRWINGEDWGYTNWKPNEPNNSYNDEDYLMMYKASYFGKWNDLNIDADKYYGLSNFGFICEWEDNGINSINPAPGSKLAANPTFNISLSDEQGISQCSIYYKSFTSTEWTLIETKQLTNDGIISVDWNTINLMDGNYDIRVSLKNALNDEYIKIYTYTLSNTPPAQAVLQAGAGNLSVNLSWTNTDSDIAYYKLYRSTEENGIYRFINKFTGTAYTDTGLSSDKTYYYYIVSVDEYGNSSTSNTVSVTPNYVDDVPPVANAGLDTTGVVNENIALDAGGSSDNVGIVSYYWDFGDGTTSTEENPSHSYENEGNYIVRLTVFDAAGNSSTGIVNVSVYSSEKVGNLSLTVKNAGGSVLSNAYVYVDVPDDGTKIYRTDSSGKVTMSLIAGSYNISAYKQGYLPSEDNFTIERNKDTYGVITLKSGELVTHETVVKPLTVTEIKEAGIDTTDPDNQYVYEIKTTLTFSNQTVDVPKITTNGKGTILITDTSSGEVSTSSGNTVTVNTNGGRTKVTATVIANEEHPEVAPMIAYLVIPVNVSWLKEFFNVQMVLHNEADPQFSIQDSEVILNLPEGLSLAQTAEGQTLSVDLGDIAGQDSAMAEWIIRGDVSGEYDLSADFTGVLMPFEADVAAAFKSEKAVTVNAERALVLSAELDDTAVVGEKYYVHFTLGNLSTNPINMLNLKIGSGDGNTAYRVLSENDLNKNFTVVSGDSIYVETLPPLGTLSFTYETVFLADTDINERLNLIEADISNSGEPIPIVTTVNNTRLDNYIKNSTFAESVQVGAVNGQAYLPVYSIYTTNESLERIFGNYMTWIYGSTVYTSEDGRITVSMPDGTTYNYNPKYDYETVSGEITQDQVTVNVNEMLLNGYTPVSRGAASYTLSSDDGGYVLETGDHNKYYYDITGKMAAYEDKTGYRVNIARSGSNITITEATTGKSMAALLNEAGFVYSLQSDDGTYSFSYDEEGNLTSITDPMGAKVNYEYTNDNLTKREDENADNVKTTVFESNFDEEGRLISLTDGKGNSREYSYNTDEYWRIKVVETDRMGYNTDMEFNRFGELVNVVDAKGNETSYTYDGNGNLASVIKSVENTVTYIYDDKDNLISYTDQNDVTTTYQYDDKSNLIKTTLPNGGIITNTYDSSNRLKTTTDEANTLTEYTYDADGNITAISITPSGGTAINASYTYANGKMTSSTDFNGNLTEYTYNADGNITAVNDPLNNVTTYEYDSNKRLIKVTYPSGHTEQYTYDNRNNVLTYTDKNGNITTNVYDANNNIFTTSTNNTTTTYTYDKEDRVLKAEDNTGAVEYTYDAVGNVVSVKDKNGNIISYAYDSFNRLVEQTTAGATTKYTLDYTDKLVAVTDPYNNVTAYTYDNMGNLTEETNSLGNKTVMTYDQKGNMLTVKSPLGKTITAAYDFRGNRTSVTDANGNTTLYTYDNNGNLTKVTDPLNGVTEYTYDGINRQNTVKDAKGNITTYAYNDEENSSSITLPNTQVYTYTYDGNGNVLTANEGSGLVTATYDYNNKPLTVTDALNNKVEYTYDPLGNPLTYKTARGNVYAYEYDGNGNLTKETDPIGGIVSYNYNAFNTATNFKDANNNNTGYSYDLLNRLTSETSATGAKDNYTYNAISQLTKYTNKRGQNIEYTYDADGNTTGRKTPEDVVIYNYDENGNLLTIEDKNGTITRLYDSLNRIVSYTNTAGQTIGYEYDSVGNLTKLTYPDGKEVTYTYNSVNQMTSVTDWNGRTTYYTYNENGKLQKVVRPDGSHEVYNYDAKGQLLTVTDLYANGNTINQYYFAYDADGNITSENSFNEPDADSISVDSSAMTYGAANQLTNFNGTPITYDEDGNALKTPLGNIWGNLTYDSLNQLTDVTVSGSAISYTYTYDAEGYRTSKTENGVTTNFVVNPNADLSQVLMSTKNGVTTYYVYGLGLISQEVGSDYKLYHYDYRGSTTAITDINGNVTDTVFYDPYGNVINRMGSTDTPFLYVGKYGVETDDNGLYYMRARYYNPQMQRFINVDPINSGNNWYAYSSGNPIGIIDPNGLLDYKAQLDEFFSGFGKPIWEEEKRAIKRAAIPGYAVYEYINGVSGAMQGTKSLITGIDGKIKTVKDVGRDASVVVLKAVFGDLCYLYENREQLKPSTAISDKQAYMLGYHSYGATEETASLGMLVYGSVQASNVVAKSKIGSLKTMEIKWYKNIRHLPSSNTSVIRHTEVKSPVQIKASEATNIWDDFLGKNQTNINPMTGLVDNNRIFSADGTRSIRFGNHEMNSMGTTKFHFHQELWIYDEINDVIDYFNILFRVKS